MIENEMKTKDMEPPNVDHIRTVPDFVVVILHSASNRQKTYDSTGKAGSNASVSASFG